MKLRAALSHLMRQKKKSAKQEVCGNFVPFLSAHTHLVARAIFFIRFFFVALSCLNNSSEWAQRNCSRRHTTPPIKP